MATYTPMERAEAFLHAGELDDALEALNDQLADQPGDQNARRLRANVLLRMDDSMQWRASLDDFQALIAPTAEDVMHRHQLLTRLDEHEQAHAYLRDQVAAGGTGHDARIVDLLLESHYRRGEAYNAITLLFDQPKTWRWLRWNGDFHALKGDHRVALDYYCSALDSLEEATQDAPPSAQAFVANLRAQILLRRADMYARVGLYAESAADYADAETNVPGDAMIPFKRGMMLFLGSDIDGAVQVCAAALQSARNDDERASLIAALKDDARYTALAASLG